MRETSRVQSLAALALLSLGLVVWLWPIGFGGRMPVGGDVTQFSIGLMAELGRALRAGRLPIWNDLWGYGFPGLAESQMGVYYPPHWALYGLFRVELAYTLSLVLHTFWGALGTYLAARRFEVSPTGSAFAGFSWAASGFFVIHLPHQWGYTTGSWMPWAWGLAWTVASGRGTPRTPLLLAMVLALQVLPGHFQLAFCTQVGVLLLALGALGPRSGGIRSRSAAVAAGLAGMLPLAAMQLWPTYRLAQLAASRRDFEYLSGFAATPLHLVSFIAPGLFQRSPLWRPLAWDPFHTSPEEHLAYIGLVPLFLALATIARDAWREQAVRALALVVLVTLVLGLGPYVPGFGLWSRLPGFAFFRAPARWSLATCLSLCILAGKGLDSWSTWTRTGRSLARFALFAALAPAAILLGVELAVRSTERPGWPALADGFEQALHLLPWPRTGQSRATTGGPEAGEPTFVEIMAQARKPQDDMRVRTALARQGARRVRPNDLVFVRERSSIYRQELGRTGLIVVGLLAIAPFTARRRPSGMALVALSALDLWALGRQRATDLGPIRPLSSQSGVVARWAGSPRASRTLDASRNLPMVAGAAPVSAYRTLDLPVLTSLTALGQAPLDRKETLPAVVAALRATGTTVRVLDPFETAQGRVTAPGVAGWDDREQVRDPALAGWLLGADWVAEQGPWASTFTLWRPGPSATAAWLVPLTSERTTDILGSWSGHPGAVLEVLDRASPLRTRRPRPERLEIEVQAGGEAVVVVSQLADPQWQASWAGPGGVRPATIAPAFARPRELGWQSVKVPGPGSWTLRLEYDGRDVRQGLAVSALAWSIWGVAFLRSGRGPASLQGGPT